eukprot:UN07302
MPLIQKSKQRQLHHNNKNYSVLKPHIRLQNVQYRPFQNITKIKTTLTNTSILPPFAVSDR